MTVFRHCGINMVQQQLVILVTHDQWRVVHFMGWRYHALRVFPANVENQGLLLEWLKQATGASVYFLTDIADEHYHVEVLPPVRGTVRKQLLTRRLAVWPYAQGLHTVHKIGSVQSANQEQLYLFSAIHYPPLREWLQALQQQTMRVQGVYTQALCTPCWVAHWQSGHAQCLIAWFESQQLSIRYLCRSKLLFSRLLTLKQDTSLGTRISSEIAQTRLYLVSQKWLQEVEPVHLIWLSEDADHNDFHLGPLPTVIQQTNLSYAEVLRQSGWQPVPAGLSVMDWAAIQVLRHSRRLPNFAPEASLLNARIASAKRNIIAACILMICLCVVANWISQQALQKMQSDIQRTNAQLHLWQSAQPGLGVPEADLPRLQILSQSVQALETSARLPHRAMAILQSVMAGQPVWQVKTLAWEYGVASGFTDEPRHEHSEQADSLWTETITIRLARQQGVISSDTQQAWQLLLEKLRQHPDILELKEISVSAESASQTQKGDTRQSLSPDHQPSLTIRLRPLESAA
ncbi:MAG: hypothetical protein ACTS9Y_05485 [Methylophilus sp.]|uniref:hypothetical protein n=1 Tax=Methylophilus sp. TaxID=29541 RepID=UPI003F9EEC4A